jgi:hypothetical protein
VATGDQTLFNAVVANAASSLAQSRKLHLLHRWRSFVADAAAERQALAFCAQQAAYARKADIATRFHHLWFVHKAFHTWLEGTRAAAATAEAAAASAHAAAAAAAAAEARMEIAAQFQGKYVLHKALHAWWTVVGDARMQKELKAQDLQMQERIADALARVRSTQQSANVAAEVRSEEGSTDGVHVQEQLEPRAGPAAVQDASATQTRAPVDAGRSGGQDLVLGRGSLDLKGKMDELAVAMSIATGSPLPAELFSPLAATAPRCTEQAREGSASVHSGHSAVPKHTHQLRRARSASACVAAAAQCTHPLLEQAQLPLHTSDPADHDTDDAAQFDEGILQVTAALTESMRAARRLVTWRSGPQPGPPITGDASQPEPNNPCGNACEQKQPHKSLLPNNAAQTEPHATDSSTCSRTECVGTAMGQSVASCTASHPAQLRGDVLQHCGDAASAHTEIGAFSKPQRSDILSSDPLATDEPVKLSHLGACADCPIPRQKSFSAAPQARHSPAHVAHCLLDTLSSASGASASPEAMLRKSRISAAIADGGEGGKQLQAEVEMRARVAAHVRAATDAEPPPDDAPWEEYVAFLEREMLIGERRIGTNSRDGGTRRALEEGLLAWDSRQRGGGVTGCLSEASRTVTEDRFGKLCGREAKDALAAQLTRIQVAAGAPRTLFSACFLLLGFCRHIHEHYMVMLPKLSSSLAFKPRVWVWPKADAQTWTLSSDYPS